MKEQKNSLGWLYRKNIIVVMVPLIVYIVIMTYLWLTYPVLQRVNPESVTSLAEIDRLYDEHSYHIRLQFHKLEYTGYNYYKNDKLAGAYYYGFLEDKSVFVLCKTEKGEIPEQLENYAVRAKVLGKNTSLEYIVNQMILESDFSYENIEPIVYDKLLSEVDFPFWYQLSVQVAVFVPYGIAILIVVCSLIWLRYPWKSPFGRQLGRIGEAGYVYQEINNQCRNEVLFQTKNYMVTKEYLIISSWIRTDVIRIDYIQFLSRHIIKKKLLLFFTKTVYRLTMSNPEKLFYEHDFQDVVQADEIMEILIKLCPNIDNKTIMDWQTKEIDNQDTDEE